MKRFAAIVGLLVFVRLVAMAVYPVFEPSEARYAAISANMARSGDFVVPRFTHNFEYQSFDGKPPLVFQAGGLFVRALGVDAPWKLQLGVRLFPLLSALLVLALLYRSVCRQSDSETGKLAVAICLTCAAFYAAAGISMTDMTLTCCVAGALLLHRSFIESNSIVHASGVAALLGAGMIVKGPVSLVMFGLPVLADACVNRRWKPLFNWRWLAVSPVYAAVAAPWFVAIERINPGSVWYFFYNENFLRFVSHDYGDKYGAGREAFRGVSVLWAVVVTLPWALVPAVTRRAGGWRSFEFLSVAAITGFWCLTSRVLLYYLFPVVPMFAAWLALTGDRALLKRLVAPAATVSLAVVVIGLGAGTLFSDKMRGDKTEFSPRGNRYAYEFYHGRKSDAELRPLREAWEKRREASRLRKLRRQQGGK